jgi:hypothetical protein
MKRLIVSALLLTIFLMPVGAVFCSDLSNPSAVFTSNAVACKDQDDMLYIMSLSHDKEATQKAILAGVISNLCIIFNKGDRVFIENTRIFRSLYQVRKKGDPIKYWTYTGAVKTN